ncbi:uncharacterized protein BDZ99DRAFT_565457 [Mytilinidion resinicola]|uniref:ER transporter 6TM N-terminal domain-containing protein n=1 Tax=Mytilinidion resinicola TaxID=574789 RepID=A0A6A6Z9R5_9PEZI|nr:uncharacterized protein BDZ99DRAFT_565457 [Mytilinidion resinicola]KAF2817756.1 hypothetical protein BDZ99DRAFT_565457 [Mytilinidion resinicola]
MLYETMKRPLLRVGLTGRVFLLMVRGALPPTIAIAMYRSPKVATVYGNFGFLIALASILSLHLQPRARFQQNIALATLLTCLAAAVSTLSHFAGLKARKHTEVLGETRVNYNSSASVVNAIFLCFVVWLVSALRAAWPMVTIPFLVCTIYSIVAITNGPGVRSEHSSLVLCKQLLLCYLTGFEISMAVSLLFFPTTSRSAFIDSSHRFVVQCRDLCIKERDILKATRSRGNSEEASEDEYTSQATAIKTSAISMLGSMSALREELSYAKQEVAFGVYTSDDMENLLHRLESLMIPLLGLSKIPIFSILHWPPSKHFSPFAELISAMMLSFDHIIEELDHALQHTAVLKLIDRDDDDSPKGDLKVLCPELLAEAEEHLYILCLLQSTSAATQELSTFARSQLVKGGGQRSRLIFPRLADIPFFSFFVNRDPPYPSTVLDPEHLPPRNAVEKFGNILRRALSSLGSDSFKFGLRIVAATMSIGIVAFLKSTQHFFVEYRVVWAVVMIPISMSPTAGTAIYGFIGRALGVGVAMLLAYVNWYIVAGRAGGVVVFFFISMMLYYFLILKYPRFIVLFILAAANHVLIIGYELQVSVKVPAEIVSPQRYFPVYTLTPYRLLCVLAALFIAFIFNVFPAQISEHKILRKNVVTSLTLLASYSSSVSATLDQRIRGLERDTHQATSPGRLLKARRLEILFKELTLLTEMRQISTMVPWEISLGGRFPKSSYDRVVDAIQTAVAFLSVIAYISQTFSAFYQLPSNRLVRDAYSASLFHHTSNEIATTLSLLALSLSADSPLTPGAQIPVRRLPQRFIPSRIKVVGADALGDPNLEAFLVVEVAGAQFVRSLEVMVRTVRDLVGTVDFGEEGQAAVNGDTSMGVV